MNLNNSAPINLIKNSKNIESSLNKIIDLYNTKNIKIDNDISNYILLTSLKNLNIYDETSSHYRLLRILPVDNFQTTYPGIFSTYFKKLDTQNILFFDDCFSYVLQHLKLFPKDLQDNFIYFFKDQNFDFYLPKTFSLISSCFDESNIEHFVLKIIVNNDEFNNFEYLNRLLDIKIDNFLRTRNTNEKISADYMLENVKYFDEAIKKDCTGSNQDDLVKKNDTNITEEILNYLFVRRSLKYTENVFLFSIEVSNKNVINHIKEFNTEIVSKTINLIENKSCFNIVNYIESLNNDDFQKILNKSPSIIVKYLNDCSNSKLENQVSFQKMHLENILDKNYVNILNYIFTSKSPDNEHSFIPETYLNALHNLLKIKCDRSVEPYINSLIEDLHSKETNLNKIGNHLSILYLIVKKDFLQRKNLNKIFNSLLYIDNEDIRVRCMVYEIYYHIFSSYNKLDLYILKKRKEDETKKCEKDIERSKYDIQKHIDNISIKEDLIARLDNSNKITKDRAEIELYSKTKELDLYFAKIEKFSRVNVEEIKNYNNNNINVLAAQIWDDLKEEKSDFELYFCVKLLNKIIENTGRFYENRFHKNYNLEWLFEQFTIDRYDNNLEKSYLEFLNLLNTISKKFNLTKNFFEYIVGKMIELYNLNRDLTREILYNLYKKDKYFFFYLVKISSKYHANIKSNKSLYLEIIEILE